MARLQVAPTRSNLLSIREDLELAREGFEILDRKREILTAELVAVAHDAGRLQERVWGRLSEAYRALEGAQLSMGRERLEWAALSVDETVEIELRPHSIMGVVLPVLTAHGAPPEIPYGLGDTSVLLDEVVADFRQVLDLVPQLAELMTTVWKLARELQKTRRRVNALQYIFIPQYEETIAYIESALEEREREEIFRLKRLKSQSRQAGEGADGTAED
ncbi:MAG: V-type ATP synthase subunit D [Anaerolineales bacterium]